MKRDNLIEIILDNGTRIRLHADEVQFDPRDRIYYFYRNGVRVGYFVGSAVEWIAPLEKGEKNEDI